MSFFQSKQIQPTAAQPVLGQGGQQGVLGSLLTQMGYSGPGASGQGLNLPFMPSADQSSGMFQGLFNNPALSQNPFGTTNPFTMFGGGGGTSGAGGFSSLFSTPQSGSVLGQPQSASQMPGGAGGGSSLDFMTQMAQGGGASAPISAIPAWNDMVAAQNRNLTSGQADLSSLFNVQGGRFSSDFGNAATDYQLQARLGQNSILSQMQLPLLQQSQQIQAGAGMALPGMSLAGAQLGLAGTGMGLQQQQAGLQTAMAPYQMQNSYLQNLMGMSNMYPPMYQPQYAPSGFNQLMGSAGSLLGGLGGLIHG